MRKLLIILPVAVVIVAALIWSQHRPTPRFVSGFIESHQIRLGSRVGGRVVKVHAVEGQTVAKDTPLVELDPYDLNARLAEAKSLLAARQATLDRLKAGYRAEEVAQARAARDRLKAMLDKRLAGPRPLEIKIGEDKLALAQAEWTKADKDFERVKKLFDQGQAAEEELDAVVRNRSVAQARLAQATDELALLREGTRIEDVAEARAQLAEGEQTLALLEAGPRSEDILEAEANVAAAVAHVESIEQQIAELIIRAPLDSIVEAVDLRPGDLIAPNAPVIALLDPGELWVRAFVPENWLDMALGQTVSIRVDSYPDQRFAGHITFISRVAEFTPSNIQTPEERSEQVFRIKVVLDEGRDVLRAGMAADVFLDATP